MEIVLSENVRELAAKAAKHAALLIGRATYEGGGARILVSTGQSQFEFFEELIKQKIDWKLATMFHLDEYIGIGESHPASFVKYLKERFVSKVPLGRVHFIDGTNDPANEIKKLNALVAKAPIDVAFIGIGENAHIAFNDPPADFNADLPFHIVALNETCKKQQVREGWFKDLASVPITAVSMTPRQIYKSKAILSIVPHKVKAAAVAATLGASSKDPNVPATFLRDHPDWTLFLDEASASLSRGFI